MSVQAYILIQTEVGKASSVARSVSAIAGVTLAEGVTGPYDVIMRAEAPSMEEFGRVILSKVQAVAGITRTLTCPVTSYSVWSDFLERPNFQELRFCASTHP
jgi:DNA-binding Lrp family transcriptional regulator